MFCIIVVCRQVYQMLYIVNVHTPACVIVLYNCHFFISIMKTNIYIDAFMYPTARPQVQIDILHFLSVHVSSMHF